MLLRLIVECKPLEPALNRSQCRSAGTFFEADIQQYVAGVIFVKSARSRQTFHEYRKSLSGRWGKCDHPGMKPGSIIPGGFGMKSNELHRIDAIVRAGLAAGAYPGCQVLVLKDGQTVYDKCFGIHSDKDTNCCALRICSTWLWQRLPQRCLPWWNFMMVASWNWRIRRPNTYLLRSTNKKNIT